MYYVENLLRGKPLNKANGRPNWRSPLLAEKCHLNSK